MMKKECRVVIYKEGLLGSLFFGEAKADPDKMSQFLSSYTREGWEVKTMSVERRRTALFWSREAYQMCIRDSTWSGWVALIWGALLAVRGLRLFVFGEWIKNWRQARLQRLLRK